MVTCYLNKEQTGVRGVGLSSFIWGTLSWPQSVSSPPWASNKNLETLFHCVIDLKFVLSNSFLPIQRQTFRKTTTRLQSAPQSRQLFCFCWAGSQSDSLPDPVLLWLKPPARGRDLWVPNSQRGACFVKLVIWSDRCCSLITTVLIQTDVKMNTLNSRDDQ